MFDRATIAAVTSMYAAKDYEAQQPTLTDRQTYDTLRKAVQTAHETLATEQKALDQGRDVLPLKLKVRNAQADLAAAKKALAQTESRRLTPEEENKLAAADAAVRAGCGAARKRLVGPVQLLI
ncbi:hypothetical protein OHA25_09930 [Nonomuraea sp. NBC_00507]|uniref:hypothetical protein n=1 Tax=Nonomuraea sp. NBC_00507 TaxID=2976002 RepID=UPI002E19EF8D